MTYAEEQEVANIVGRLVDHQAHCFPSQQAARQEAEALKLSKAWSMVHTVDLSHHNGSGSVVVVTGVNDPALGVVYEAGKWPILLDVLRRCAEQGESPW